MSEIESYPTSKIYVQGTHWNHLLDHGLEKTASYIIRKSGTTYQAINGSTGKIDYTGADSGAVFNDVVAILTNGGVIRLKQTTFTCTEAPLIDQDNIHVFGENTGTIWKVANTTSINAFKITGDDCSIQNLTIDGNRANNPDGGVEALQNGIYSTGAERVKVVDAKIVNMPRRGIFLSNATALKGEHQILNNYIVQSIDNHAAILTDDAYCLIANNVLVGSGNNWTVAEQSDGITLYEALNCVVIGNDIRDFCRRGIYVVTTGSTTGGHTIEGNMIYNSGEYGILVAAGQVAVNGNIVISSRKNSIYLNGYGITCNGNYVYGSETQSGIYANVAFDLTINNNVVDNNYAHGIFLDTITDATVSQNIVKNNSQEGVGSNRGIALADSSGITILGNRCFDDQGAKTQREGIFLTGTSNYCVIIGNDVRGNQTAGMSLVGANNIVRNNLGWITENTGTSTGTGAEETIAHGCDATPTKITITPTVTGATVTDLYQQAGADHFHVTVTLNKTYNWKAEV